MWFFAITLCEARVREYFVAAVEEEWNYCPSYPTNLLTNDSFTADQTVFVKGVADGGESFKIGHKYIKALYKEYTDATFSELKPRPAELEHLGFLGPLIRAEVGDTIKITFTNQGTVDYTMHPHGVRYDKASEGAWYQDGRQYIPWTEDVVSPGSTHVYHWNATEDSGPIPGSGMSSVNWWYHSHKNSVSEEAAGLIGPIVICAKGMCNDDAKPLDVDKEMFTMFMVMDENASTMLDKNIETYLTNGGGAAPTDDEQADFEESNKMHTMNGWVYGNLGSGTPMTMTAGDLVRWYLFAVGNEVDLHTAHWHGNTVVTVDGMRSDVERLLPASMTTVDMIPDNPGQWLYHCHVADHMTAGMMATYTVEPCEPNCRTGDEKKTYPVVNAIADYRAQYIPGPSPSPGTNPDAYSVWALCLGAFAVLAWLVFFLNRLCCAGDSGGLRLQSESSNVVMSSVKNPAPV